LSYAGRCGLMEGLYLARQYGVKDDWFHPPGRRTVGLTSSLLGSFMFTPLSTIVVRRPWLVVLGWLVFALGVHICAPRWDQVTKDDDVRFFPSGSLSVIGQELLERGFPVDAASSQLVLIYERSTGPVTLEDLRYIENVAVDLYKFSELRPELGVKRIYTHRSPAIGSRLIGSSPDGAGQAVLTIVSLEGTYLSKRTRLAVDRIDEWLKSARPAPPPGLSTAASGSAVVGHDTNSAANESINNTTKSTIALVVVILLLVYRSPVMAMVPLVTIALSVFASLRLIALLSAISRNAYQVINITQVFVVVVLFGAGTDYCLFLIARYAEELGQGRERLAALGESISRVGGALVASAGTVIVGLAMLWFSSFAKVRFTGPTIAISLTIALAAALTLAPALLAILRAAVFWPFHSAQVFAKTGNGAGQDDAGVGARFWMRAADLVVSRPGWILGVCLLVLAPLSLIGARTPTSYNQLSDLDADRASVIGANVVRRYFAVGELSPAVVLLDNPRIDFNSEPGRAALSKVSDRLAALDNVAEVRSLTRPLGKPVQSTAERGFLRQFTDRALKAAIDARYVSTNPMLPSDRNHIARVDVIFKTDPFSVTNVNSLDQVNETIRELATAGQPLEGTAKIGVTGVTASVRDLRLVTTNDERRMYVLVTLGVYAILVALLRRPGISLYLIFTVVIGYLASLGLTDLVFRSLHRGPSPWNGLDWVVGFFLFVILVAVGEDYNIFLMSRVVEEERLHGTIEGTRRATARTGGIISSCGLIMAGTFGSMLTGNLTSLRQLGFALGMGVLLDTFLVRPILVPAFVVLMARLRSRSQGPAEPLEAGALAGRTERA
jgi:RND superfamily putative drug exporter